MVTPIRQAQATVRSQLFRVLRLSVLGQIARRCGKHSTVGTQGSGYQLQSRCSNFPDLNTQLVAFFDQFRYAVVQCQFYVNFGMAGKVVRQDGHEAVVAETHGSDQTDRPAWTGLQLGSAGFRQSHLNEYLFATFVVQPPHFGQLLSARRTVQQAGTQPLFNRANVFGDHGARDTT